MFSSLYSKIAAGLTGLFLLVGLGFVGITVFSTDMYQQEVNQELNTGLARQIVRERVLMEKGRVNHEALQEIFHMLMVINPGIEIYLLDTRGKILTYSAPEGSVKRAAVDLLPVKQWINNELSAPLLGEDPKSLTREKVFSAAPIERSGELEGYLYVILGGEAYDSVVQKLKGSYILQLSVWMTAAGILFALVAGMALFAVLTGRLKKLAVEMEAFRRGEPEKSLQMQLPAPGQKGPLDEIDRLSMTFKDMAERIEVQMSELKESDRMRRELVTNVCHDLRTPLANLQGYIETLLVKDVRYSPDERRHYLEIAIRQCRRLNTLINELLELARLESPRMQIHPEPFNIQELVQDISLKFALAARKKRIKLILRFEDGLPFVTADIALIERALENLIENAIHYTPENGSVFIESSFEKQVLIQVRDTGPGISEHELKHIFERFYHSEPLKKARNGHLGLGLAITSRIVQLHHRQINVSSEPGKGSCFSFTLPAV